MKPLLLIACLFLSLGIKAQSNVYKPFPLVDGATWKIKWQGEGCVVSGNPQTYFDHVKYQYTIQGDTVVDTLIYKKLYMGPLIGFPYVNCYPQLPLIGWESCIGALRQDTIAKKVFFFPKNASQEYLLYDFGMQVGDTIKGYMNLTDGYAGPYVVSGFDSILIGSEYHRTVVISGVYFIEGVGSYFGLIESPRYFEAGSNLLCFSLNGNNLLGSTYDCNLDLTSTPENKPTPKISIFPNPASSDFTIKADNPTARLTVTLYNLTGQQVGSYSSGENQILIPRNNLPDGLYVAQIQAGSSVVRRKMLLVD